MDEIITQGGNSVEYLTEQIECVHTWLDKQRVPRGTDDDKEYSLIGRLEAFLRGDVDVTPQEERTCRDGHTYVTAKGDLGACWCGQRPALELVGHER